MPDFADLPDADLICERTVQTCPTLDPWKLALVLFYVRLDPEPMIVRRLRRQRVSASLAEVLDQARQRVAQRLGQRVPLRCEVAGCLGMSAAD
jgi:hypothetical protein